jgi:ATP synthase, Delta/Epsilon chain, long alpha-helix domain
VIAPSTSTSLTSPCTLIGYAEGISVENMDAGKAQEARQRAAARLREKISSEEVASVDASLARSLAQLQVKRRRRGRVLVSTPH